MNVANSEAVTARFCQESAGLVDLFLVLTPWCQARASRNPNGKLCLTFSRKLLCRCDFSWAPMGMIELQHLVIEKMASRFSSESADYYRSLMAKSKREFIADQTAEKIVQ
jgi:hypothetical protein